MTTDFLQLSVTLLASWGVLILLLSWGLALLFPVVRPCLQWLPVQSRAFSYLVYSLMPCLTASIILGFYTFPEVASRLVARHCHDVHCLPHLPHAPIVAPLGHGTVWLTMIGILLLALITIKQLLLSQRYLTALRGLSQTISSSERLLSKQPLPPKSEKSSLFHRLINKRAYFSAQPIVQEIPTDKPIAWCVGLWRPQVFISRQLRESLTAPQLNMLLAHEFAHASRKDSLRKWLLNITTQPWPKAIKNRIRREFGNDIEIIADLIAIGNGSVGDNEQWLHQAAINCCGLTFKNQKPDQCSSGTHEKHLQATQVRVLELKKQQRDLASKTFFNKITTSGIYVFFMIGWLCVLLSLMHYYHFFIEWLFR